MSQRTGERRTLVLLREWPRCIAWLYTKIDLPGLVDGWILADEYHQSHPCRAVLYADGLSVERRPKPDAIFLREPVAPSAILSALNQADALGAPRSTVTHQDDWVELGMAA
jgi:hypothetical protein